MSDNNQIQPDFSGAQISAIHSLYNKFHEENSGAVRPCVRLSWEPLTAGSVGPKRAGAGGSGAGKAATGTQTTTRSAAAATDREYADDLFVSKLGGTPFWPRTKPTADDEIGFNLNELGLLAQFNLSEIPPATLEQLRLPTDGGILQFFIGTTPSYGLYDASGSGKGYHVQYHTTHAVEEHACDQRFDAEVELARLQALEKPGSKSGLYFPLNRSEPQRILFGSLSREQMSPRDVRFEDTFADFVLEREKCGIAAVLGSSEKPEKWRILSVLHECEPPITDQGAGSKLRGNPTFVQQDKRHFPKKRDGDADGPGDPCAYRSNELLFQLDSDNQAVCVGDCGVMNFFISQHSLSRREFEGVDYDWQCS